MSLSLDNKEINVAKSFLYFKQTAKVHKCILHTKLKETEIIS